jgi:hypothetical protein
VVIANETHRPEAKYGAEFTKKPFDWNLFVSTTSAGVLAFATIYALVNRSTTP